MEGFKHSPIDIILTCLGLVFLLVDIVLDAWAVVTFYQEGDFVSLGALLLFLLGSSVLVQVYSWLLYKYDDDERVTRVERSLSLPALGVLHVFQLGIYVRHAGVFEAAISTYITKWHLSKVKTSFLSHDLSMLRLIETFSESAPQLVLMLTLILHRGSLDRVTVLKAVGSAAAMACSVTMFHRSLRSFLPDKKQQRWDASVVYFLWNLLLIAPRLVALALFVSVLPWYILLHFGVSWLVLFFCAWRAKTDFMESTAGEVLFRATVGLIWFFSWFSVVEGKTRYKSLMYHMYIVVDMCLLCGLWCWQIHAKISFLYAIITSVCVIGVYMLGLGLKAIYYRLYHPNVGQQESKTEDVMCVEPLQGDVTDNSERDVLPAFQEVQMDGGDYIASPQSHTLTDGVPQSAFRMMPHPAPVPAPVPAKKRQHKMMMKLAGNFNS